MARRRQRLSLRCAPDRFPRRVRKGKVAAADARGTGMATLEELAAFIHGKMITNVGGATTKALQKHNDSILGFYDACTLWQAWVGNRKPWDYKIPLKTTYGDWADDGVSGRSYGFDIWSNLHYGYVGCAAGFSAFTLKSGAGYAQWKAGTSPPGYFKRRLETLGDADVLAALDDPLDQAAIVLGCDLWGAHGDKLTLEQLLAATRKAAPKLNTKPLK
jgi:hypothetical protein